MKCSKISFLMFQGCLLFFLIVNADKIRADDNGTPVINHPNARLLPKDCGKKFVNETYETPLGQFPWLVLLMYRKGIDDDFYCGGQLINDRYVLTSAQCISYFDRQLIGVRIGDYDVRTDPDCVSYKGTKVCADPVQEIGIEEEVPYTEFSKSDRYRHYDIALLRLRRSAQFNDYVQPICLPFGEVGMENQVNKSMWAAGWGRGARAVPERFVQEKAEVTVIGFNECTEELNNRLRLAGKDNQICTDPNDNYCTSDLGGPLLRPENEEGRWYSFGVMSIGVPFCVTSAWPEVYTKTSHYLNWILDTIRE